MRPLRILAVDDDVLLLRTLEAHLTASGIQVLAVREATWAVPRAIEFQPDLMLVDRHMPVLSGPEIVRALRAFPQTLGTPVAMLTADASPASVVRCIRAGAVDVLFKPVDAAVLARVAELLDEVRAQRLRGSPTPAMQVKVLLDLFRRLGREGVLRLNPGTPFEGRAQFGAGELLSAHLGPVEGKQAVEEMLTFEEGQWQFDDGPAEPSKVEAPPAQTADLVATVPPRLLLVDDDGDLRLLFSTQLRRAGFAVETAVDGRDGLQVARASPFDVVIADLNMPRLDGWGFLRELRADLRTRELPVIFLSAHDDYRETLKAAKSGAWDYLPKTGRADLVIARSLAALEPRRAVKADIQVGVFGPLDLRVLGPRWTLGALAEARLTGTLRAKDDWAQYTVTLREGDPIGARAEAAGRSATGAGALGALLISKSARGKFHPGPVEEQPQFNATMTALLDTAAVALNELEARALSARLAGGARIEVDPELYELYRRVCAERDLRIARALCEQKVRLDELAPLLGLPQEEVEVAVTDLLRRTVVRLVG